MHRTGGLFIFHNTNIFITFYCVGNLGLVYYKLLSTITSSQFRHTNAGRKRKRINSSPVTKKMASSSSYYTPFSALFAVSKPNPSLNPAAFLVPSLKFSTAISNFANLSNGFSLKSPVNHGFLFKSRTFNVQARAAAEKTVHEFTVKVWSLSF